MRNVVDGLIGEVFARCRENRTGDLADYIPELAAVAPDSFSLCIATSDGYVYESGDAHTEFTIQSISKPLTYGLALADRGLSAVAEKIDVEPSGEPFNEISLDPVTERPRNPMINAGAIAAASLIDGDDPEHRFERLRQCYSRYAGRELALNEAVYRSEARTGHRNRAIGHMLRSFGIITADPDLSVDLYFRQCSIDVTCRDLALVAATLANNGVNPVTHERALSPDHVERVLSVMTTCGMYDAAGDWVTQVGLPAKSGVGGGVLAVLPGQIGIAVYSPRLDAHGNSVRGVQACRELSKELELHFLHVTRAARSAVRSSYSVAEAPSRQRRGPAERDSLEKFGQRARIYELHGDLLFAGTETAVREITAQSDELEAVAVDVRRVDDVSGVAGRMLSDLYDDLGVRGCQLALVDPAGRLGHTTSGLVPTAGARVFVDLDAALEWCEDTLLDRHCAGARLPESITVAEHPLLSALSAEQFDRFAGELEIRTVAQGEVIVHRGDPAAGLFLILAGRVSNTLQGADGVPHRITTLAPGMTFGEMPLLIGERFLGDVHADTDVRLAVLPPDRFAHLSAEAPGLKVALLEELAAGAYAQMDAVIRSLTPRGRLG
ncbi:glutaminase [Rhodococcus sp. PvR044]|jgi:glutaminase|uniref:glutaminase A n=1 Tax=unclassified Rhodococcus (in: high G+C Gram-positive bacteria) TaxID=192944 RepID=UPI000BD11F4F|nr:MULTISPECIES: glutaminase A [unclassified Rhodococcus (in: high G+C Gram-positive bacteria)]MBP1158449.1 glutaminase [Rhodococcus sp. PvR099]PTR43875.1 L-glutaminase [Rhodococcus sp. OK611]SNX90693.1 L-glutaminase [Rhodococcus sp. OK270]